MITKPLPWVVHLQKDNVVPIFSIDICPFGNFFATGGEDGVIKVWKMKCALINEKDSGVGGNAPLVVEIKVHDKGVSSVRFNKSGKLLASGGTDGIVSVAILLPFGTWKTIRKFHQQKLDISEVAWGTQERTRLLASCSLDGTIVIWDIQRGQAQHTINAGQALLKGLAWDPLGQYLATQAEGDGVFIYRTSDWKRIQEISKPFAEFVGSSDHLRLSWSPNGMYLAGVQAYTLPQPYVAILVRDRWNLECCIVGHRSGITISKWNPRLFQSPNDSGRLSMCLALGSMDQTLSLWRQTDRRPILHIDGLFDNWISDIAWSADGYTCLVSSRSGLVALLNFTEEELGKASSFEVSYNSNLTTSSSMPVAENLSLWMLEQQSNRKSIEKRMTPSNEDHPEIKKQRKEAKSIQVDQPMSIDPVQEQRQSSLIHQCESKALSDGSWHSEKLSVENSMSGKHCVVIYLINDQEHWRDEIDCKAILISGNSKFCVIALESCFLRIYNNDGFQLISGLQLPSQAAQLVVDENWLLLSLTKCGEISLWNIQERTILCRSSVCTLCKTSQLATIKLSPNSLPIVVLSDNRVFLYHKGMESWVSLFDSYGLTSGSGHREGETRSSRSFMEARHVSSYQTKQELEQGIMSALDLDSVSDYQKWLVSYVRYLIARISKQQAGNEEDVKLRKICTNLVSGKDQMQGFDHRRFLKEKILPEVRRVRDLQRLAEEIDDWSFHIAPKRQTIINQINLPSASKMKTKLYLSIAEHHPFKEQSGAFVKLLSGKYPDLDVKTIVDEDAFFNVERFNNELTTKKLGRVLMHTSALPSTQDLIRSVQNSLPHGVICTSQIQTRGKGRGVNNWTSPIGCVMFSVLTHLIIDTSTIPFLNYIVCLAIIRAIKFLSKRELQGIEVDVKIKWPNDIYYDNQKLGGILLNSSLQGNRLTLVTGIGLNVTNAQPTCCLKEIFEEVAKDRGLEFNITLEDTLAAILNHLEPLFKIFEEKGFGPMKDEYLKLWIHSGQKLKLDSRSVVVKGITKDGFLQAEDENGEILELVPDGTSVDMMQGLISRTTDTHNT
eukprot:g6217.t1